MSNDAFQKNQSVVGGVGNDTDIGFSRSMFALSLNSRVTQQVQGTGEDWLCQRLYILELLDCYLRWAGIDQVCALTTSNFVPPPITESGMLLLIPSSGRPPG